MLVAATVHFPYMTAWPERASAHDRERTLQGFARIAAAIADAGIETLVVFTSEHIVNLQPRMAPAFTIGTGDAHRAFAEPQFNLAPTTRPGDPALATHLVRALYQDGFDPAHSSDLQLDHGTTLPLAQLGLPTEVAIVPVIVNSIFAPLPTLARCAAFGAAVSRALARFEPARRVGVLATGGLSHSVGTPGMDRNDPGFDADFVGALARGDMEAACRFSDAALDAAGNGTHEVRNWIAAAAAAHPRRAGVVTSIAFAPGWDSGVHQLLWENA